MPSVGITTPTSNSTVAHTFQANGPYNIADLELGNGPNTIQSVVTQGSTTLDTQVYTIAARNPSGTWAVTHTVAGTETLTDCVVTASLFIDAIETESADVNNITISG